MKQCLLFVIGFCLAVIVCGSTQVISAENLPFLSFQEALQNVQEHYPALRKQHYLLEEAIKRNNQAVAGLLPRLQGRLAWSRSDDPTQVFMYKLKQESFTLNDFLLPNLNDPSHRDDYSAALRLEIPIFDGFQTISAIQATKHMLNSRENENRFFRMQASLLAIEAYLNAVLSQRLILFSDAAVKASRADIKEAVSLKAQGFVLGADYYAGKVTSAFILKIRNALYARQRTTRIYLNILQGKEIGEDYSVSMQLPVSGSQHKSIERWIHEALLLRSDLAAMQEAVFAQESEVKREGAKILPRISAFGERSWHTNDFDQTGEHYMVGVQGTMDFFDPAYISRISSSKAVLEQRKQDLAALKDMITQTVSEASNQHQTLIRDLEVLEQAAKDAREAVSSVEKLYKKGRKSIADLQQMRQMQLSTEIAYNETLVKTELSRCRLLFLSGQLDDAEVQKIAKRIHP
jgi:outer membrane protein TolC